MIIWGGSIDAGITPTGGRYNPSTDTWVRTPLNGSPEARMWPVAVWTGSEAVFWGGYDQLFIRYFNDGGRYNPSTNRWGRHGARRCALAPRGAGHLDRLGNAGVGRRQLPYRRPLERRVEPVDRHEHAAGAHALVGGRWSTVWTGRQMIVWGGFGPTQKGGLYCLSGQGNIAPSAVADTWTAPAGKPLRVGSAGGVLRNDSDGNGDPLSARLISGPAHGTLRFNANGSFSYRPAPGFIGNDGFSYVANDDLLDSAHAQVTIKVK